MAQYSSIEWTDATWNPVTGCTKVSAGCANCYAERMANRLKAMGMEKYRNGFKLTLHRHLLSRPLEWTNPRMIFVASMSDLFHEDVPLDFIQGAFQTMVIARQHIFQILTKRSERLARLAEDLPWPENIWAGVTVEDKHNVHRIEDLAQVPAHLRFVSCEPLIGPLPELPLGSVGWVIVGGESGPGARPMEGEWVDDIRRQCNEHEVPFFFKQWGGVRKQASGRLLHGRIYDELPSVVPESCSSARVATD